MQDLKSLCLTDFLEYKTLYYDKIDFSIVKNSWEILSTHINLPYIIHVVGTNGKGSTGRFLAHYLTKQNYKTLHYSSPHIQKFNERIWINGSDVSDEALELAHKKIQEILPLNLLQKLTYFEHTTLLALLLSNDFDYLVLEAGLGGEFDATNVVDNNLSLITTIGLDHQSFLGETVEEIAATKMRACDKKMLVGFQVFDEVEKTAFEVQRQLANKGKNIEVQIVKEFDKYELDSSFATYLKRNLHLVTACLEELNIDIKPELFNDVQLFGRCQKIKENITIDVGHNPLAAQVLAKQFEGKKVELIYNSYADKDYKEVLRILKPIIKKITIIELEDRRIVEKNNLIETINNLGIICSKSDMEIRDDKEYLVFGSFLVVEKFLEKIGINER